MFLGLDLGTSAVKALLIDQDQAIVAESQSPLTVQRPHSAWSEQSPAEWLKACGDALDELAKANDLSNVQAIGLSGHMHGATLIDAAGDVLRPCILWNDTRSSQEAAQLDADPVFRAVSGNIVFPGFTAPKLGWVKSHEPKLFDQVAKVLLPKDYLRLWLTGEYVSEMSDAAGTSWLDVGTRAWSDALLEKTGLSRDHMPALVEGAAASATLRKEICDRWGFDSGTVVAGGAGDNAATAVGMGVTAPGQGFLSLGTSGVLFAATSGYSPDAASAVHTFCHAIPDTWHQMGVILSAADALDWYGKMVGQKPSDLSASLGTLTEPGRTMFLPYLGGERTPHNDAAIRGSFIGLEHATDTQAGAKAVMEGVAFAMRDALGALQSTGTEITELTAVGGGSQSQLWLEMMATALDMSIRQPVAGDFGAAFGAARLGALALGADESFTATAAAQTTIEPNPKYSAAFADAYQRYSLTYQAIKSLS